VFTYNDRLGWFLNIIAGLAAIAAGVVLPLMDVVFGKFVNTFNDFVIGKLSPDGFMDQVNHFT
jgi:ATP-binding cassette subfamily B (MDR/TAP) protein 1